MKSGAEVRNVVTGTATVPVTTGGIQRVKGGLYIYSVYLILRTAEGWPASREQVQRIRRREGLKVAPKPKEDPASGRIHRTPDSGLLSKPRVELGFSLRPNGEWRHAEDDDLAGPV